jgi:hypothetical protein
VALDHTLRHSSRVAARPVGFSLVPFARRSQTRLVCIVAFVEYGNATIVATI